MNWFTELFTNGQSVAHILMLYSIVISVGVILGKIKIGGVSLGVTFVLFAGIIAGHILHQENITEPALVLNFVQDFGLILFVSAIGLQVGPSFFTSFKQGGIKMNIIATGIIASHHENISRLRNGTERKIGQKKAETEAAPDEE